MHGAIILGEPSKLYNDFIRLFYVCEKKNVENRFYFKLNFNY